jgi:nucleoside 2-deoxyribosyltransferase
MSKPLVYLSGPITGLTYKDGNDWRVLAHALLNGADTNVLSPLRGNSYLPQDSPLDKSSYEEYPLSTGKGITTRDRFDTMRCDVMLVNLLGAQRVSIGTMIELGWADAARVPIVLVMEKEGNPHDHAMVQQIVGYRVDTLEEGLWLVNALLKTGV